MENGVFFRFRAARVRRSLCKEKNNTFETADLPVRGRRVNNHNERITTMKTVMKAIFGASISAILQFGMSGSALAQGEVCSEQTLRGTFVFNAHGFNIVNGAAQPKAIVEGITFNGDGTLSVPFATVSINGQIIQVPPGGTGVYTVQGSCQGTLNFTNGPSFNIFVRPNGKSLWMIQTDPNTVFQGTVAKVALAP